MKPIACVFFLLLIFALAPEASARDRRQVAAFRKANPCPATGQRSGACPGWVIDHVIPLCLSGADHPGNMQWQTRAASYKKDAQERRACAREIQ